MRLIIATLLTAISFSAEIGTLRAATPDKCKVCSDQQRACMKNYAGPTCKTEYQMCIKSCRSK